MRTPELRAKFPDAPKRKPFYIFGHLPHVFAALECGHMYDRPDRRCKTFYCFDCFYGKPHDRLVLELMNEKGVTPCA